MQRDLPWPNATIEGYKLEPEELGNDGSLVIIQDGDGKIQRGILVSMVVHLDSPITIYYNRDAPAAEKIILTGLHEANKQQRRAAIDGIEPFLERWEKRGGGATPAPDSEKLEAVLGWREAQGKQTKDSYARSIGVDASTLYRWEKDLERKDKL